MTSRKFWLGVALFWMAFGLVAGLQVWISMITHGHSVPLLVGHYILVWESWLGFTAIIVWMIGRYPIVPPTGRNVLIHTFAAVVVGIAHTSLWLGLTQLLRPYDRMNPVWSEISLAANFFYRLPLGLIIYAGVAGAMQARDYYSRYRAREVEAAQLQTSLTNAKLHALELQIQPHFLFNTLNAVTSLVRTGKNNEAIVMIAGLSDILRYTLDHEGNQRVTLEAETEMLRRYLEIQRTRFADRMTFSIDVDPSARTAAVPTLILQPLAENAVRHGIARSAAGGSVSVKAFRENGHLRVDIFNTGVLAARTEGIGLRNTRERLQQLYAADQKFELRESAGGVIASLTIPWAEVV